MKKLIPLLFVLAFPMCAYSQAKSFEFTNQDAIELTAGKLNLLLAHPWEATHVDLNNRGVLTETQRWTSLDYKNDGTFEYAGFRGRWSIVENKYIRHKLNSREEETRSNFGGIYAVTLLTDSTLTLVKLLTSTHDMKRMLYFQESRPKPAIVPRFSFHYQEKPDEKTLDSISRLSNEELFIFGFYVDGDTIIVQTPDSLYRVKRKKRE